MTGSKEVELSVTNFTQVLDASARLPGVRIDRAAYLRAALKRHCSSEQIEQAIAQTPAAAGISLSVIETVATTSIRYETVKVTGLSTAAGISGGLAIAGTVPADLAQYFGHIIRIAQKLAYIYSWPDLFADDEELDEATAGVLTLFIGVMFGVQTAQAGISKVSTMIASQVVKKLPQKALTQGTVYPVVKKGRRSRRCSDDQADLRERRRQVRTRPGWHCFWGPHVRDLSTDGHAVTEASRRP